MNTAETNTHEGALPLSTTEGPAHPAEAASSRYSWFVLIMLMIVYASNFVDRTIVSILGQAIKEDLKLADWQLGVIGGIAFALLYTVLGFPIAKLADRHNRVNIISICVVVWSAMTAVCGLANNFLQLFLARVGVGIGEAGCVPPAHSLIADYFPASKRARALSVFSMGVPIGSVLGLVIGGFIVQHYGWRAAFYVVGLPGILIALLFRLFVKEPRRGASEATVEARHAAEHGEATSLRAAGKRLWDVPTARHLSIAITLSIVSGYGIGHFSAPFLIRKYGLNYAEVAAIIGSLTLFSTSLGMLGGGYLADYLGRKDKRWYAWLPAGGFALAAPIHLAAYIQDSWLAMVLINLVATVFTSTYLAPGFAVIHNIVQPRMRAGASAFVHFGMNLFGVGLGPVLVGVMIDMIAQSTFGAAGLGDFSYNCPGGLPRVAGDVEAALACRSTLADATQWTFILWQPFCLWTALHFYLASKTIRRDMS